MKIKTLADILNEEHLAIHGEGKTNAMESQSPYFEDDPAFQEFTDSKNTNKPSNRDSFTSNTRFKKNETTKNDTKKGGTKKNRTTKHYVKKNHVDRNNVKKNGIQKSSVKQSVKQTVIKKSTVTKTIKTNQQNDLLSDANADFSYGSRSDSSSHAKPIDNLTEKLPTLLPKLLETVLLDTRLLETGLKTPEQRQAEKDEIKAERRLRWLAFYYLSTREHSAQELKDKLLAKEQDAQKIDELLKEFEEKGYQSDMRTALMLIREGIRKGRGRRRIKQDFYKRKVAVPSNIDELIDMANEESAEFVDFVDDDTVNASNGKEQVNWLKLAVEARIKKYGDDIPTEPKEKAKQLRFLQYRGFNTDVCFEALQHDLDSVGAVF